ncbi:hypothetical protein BKA65DRAFT_559857 [Rhexocercosporidium sp. MPI-PUGE-AT-0058]|nr:hypothetical protein BKA65DRAFT_559857 [Rhexocercosporidium sp. MPI-PUGE-AT-0058]
MPQPSWKNFHQKTGVQVSDRATIERISDETFTKYLSDLGGHSAGHKSNKTKVADAIQGIIERHDALRRLEGEAREAADVHLKAIVTKWLHRRGESGEDGSRKNTPKKNRKRGRENKREDTEGNNIREDLCEKTGDREVEEENSVPPEDLKAPSQDLGTSLSRAISSDIQPPTPKTSVYESASSGLESTNETPSSIPGSPQRKRVKLASDRRNEPKGQAATAEETASPAGEATQNSHISPRHGTRSQSTQSQISQTTLPLSIISDSSAMVTTIDNIKAKEWKAPDPTKRPVNMKKQLNEKESRAWFEADAVRRRKGTINHQPTKAPQSGHFAPWEISKQAADTVSLAAVRRRMAPMITSPPNEASNFESEAESVSKSQAIKMPPRPFPTRSEAPFSIGDDERPPLVEKQGPNTDAFSVAQAQMKRRMRAGALG